MNTEQMTARGLRDALVHRLLRLRDAELLQTQHVRSAARSAGVSERTVWRWLEQGTVRHRERRAPVLSETEREWVFATRGNIAAAHRGAIDADATSTSLAAFRRRVARDMTPGERAYARDGAEGRRRHDVYMRWEPRYRGQFYEADHKQMAIEVIVPRVHRPQRPWVTLIIDAFSRLIVGWALSLQPTQAEVLAALRAAVVDDPSRPFGGVPEVLRVDGGLEFAAEAVEEACGAMAVLIDRTQPYSPWQKGKIERLNRTIDDTLLRSLPGWTDGPRAANGRLLGANERLELKDFVELFARWVVDYNQRRPHAGLRGQTPLERWNEDAHPVERLPVEQARWMLMAGETRVLGKGGIEFRTKIYLPDRLSGLAGVELDVRYMPHDLRTIELYHEGKWLTTARRQDEITAEQRERELRDRSEKARALARRARRARRLVRQRLAPITDSSRLIEDLGEPARRDELAARRPRRSSADLKLLNLGDRVDSPTDAATELGGETP